MQNGTRLAAVDLGSNSFRLEIGRLDHGQIHRTEYLKETVRQGNGLDGERNLTPEAMQRGWECLARFGERLAGFRKNEVRAVATQTLREARNRDEFLARAHQVLGFPIDVISGREEARLIYQGVVHMLPQSDERRLVVDIGGRSTEMILGQGLDALVMESYRVGSVAWSMKYFPDGQFTARAFAAAEVAAKAVLDEALNLYPAAGWEVAYGSSGTVGAVADVLAAAGMPQSMITREGLDWLLDRLLKAQSADRLRLEGMKDDRRAVIGGGVSVLRAVFELLDIRQMQVGGGGRRPGGLDDLRDREEGT
ncbi:MAG: exopolyphosphatase, partial [Polaromonas sp.]